MASPRTALLLVAVGLLLAALFAVFGGSDGSDVAAVEPASVGAAGASSGDSFALADDEQVTPSARAHVVDPDALDERDPALAIGRTWRELVRPIDDDTGEPIVGTWIVRVAPDGERRRIELDEVVGDDDVVDGALLAIDGLDHVFRPFWARAVDPEADEPTDVRLRPAGQVHFVAASIGGAQVEGLRYEVAPIEEGERSRELAASFGFDGSGGWNLLALLAQHLYECVADPTSDAGTRSTHLLTMRPIVAGLPFDRLGGPPLVLPLSAGGELGAGSLRTVDDLDCALPLRVWAEGGETARFRVRGESEWSSGEPVQVTFGERLDVMVDVEAVGHAGVRGRVAAGVEEGRVWISGELENLHQVILEQALWRPARYEPIARAGDFAFAREIPGPKAVLAEWRDGAGVHRQVVREFELAPGERLDLGLLSGTDGATVTVEPKVLVDGVELESADQIAGTLTWRLALVPTDVARTGWRDHIGRGLESVRLGDVPNGVYRAEVSEVRVASGDDLDAFLGTGPPYQVRGLRIEGGSTLLVDGDVALRPVIELERTAMLHLRIVDPSSDDDLASLNRPVVARLWNRSTGQVIEPNGTAGFSTSNGVHARVLRVGLTPGAWTVVAVDRGGTSGDASEFGCVGLAEVVVEGGDGNRADVELEPAAAVVAPVRASELGRAAAVVPVGWPDAMGELWSVRAPLGDEPQRVFGCLPGTAYRVVGGDRTGTTGSAGTTLDLSD